MTLHHLTEGDGPTVVLLHAGVADLRMWDRPVAALVESGRRVVRCDLRGYGGSPLAPGTSYGDAEDVLALLDELGVDRCALVGASYGGYVAQQVASARPDRVDRLVLVNAPADLAEPDDGLKEFWEREGALVEAGDLAGATELNVATWLGPDADDETRALVRTMQARAFEVQVAAGDVDDRELSIDLDALTMPVVVVLGLEDFAFFVDNARALADRLPDARLVELAGAGHLPTLERPDEGARLLLDALS